MMVGGHFASLRQSWQSIVTKWVVFFAEYLAIYNNENLSNTLHIKF